MHIHIRDSVLTIKRHKLSALTFYSYIFDWAFYILILVLLILYGRFVPPIFHEFLLNDIKLLHRYKPEDESIIPIWLLILIAVGLPVIQIVLCSILCGNSLTSSRRLWDIHCGLLVLTGSMACQLMVTCILKNICGLPRPDLVSRCEPSVISINEPFSLATIDICSTSNIDLLWEGFRSFPSGHLSTVFSGMVICSMNISGKLQVFDSRGLSIKVVLAIVPIMIACFVSCTRISDNRHFLRDVIGGSLNGSVIGAWFYLQYFPSIFNLENNGRAFPPRRLGVSRFFNNVGGFWFIDEKLAGSFAHRNLNDNRALQKLHNFQVPLSTEEIRNVEQNIKVINSINGKLKKNSINLPNAHDVV